MTSPIDNFIASGGTSGAPTAPNSRYYRIPTTVWTAPDGTQIRYLQRRLAPQPDRFSSLRDYTVIQGDRIDSVAAKQLGDPQLSWLLCDANGAMDPFALVAQPGATLTIPTPSGTGTING